MTRLWLDSAAAQEALGGHLARVSPPGLVIYLDGELGTGKTTLARGFLRGLGFLGPVRSPTYTLIEPYPFADRLCYHLDLYRLGDPGELEYLGIRDLLTPETLLLVEWPERGAGELPPADLVIHLDSAPGGRWLTLAAASSLGEEVLVRLNEGRQNAAFLLQDI